MEATVKPQIDAFFDQPTYTISYLVSDPATKDGAVIDPVLDFDQKSGRTGTKFADSIVAAAAAQGIRIVWILETHAHADHLSAAAHLRRHTRAPVAIGAEITKVQATFKALFNAGDVTPDGRAFYRLLHDSDGLPLGELRIEAMHTPGHTPACMTYRIGDAAFVGDTLFMPDYGTARADFPGGDAHTLHRSIRRILDLPPETRLFVCHDYKAPGRDRYAWETTVAEERARNVQIHDGIGEDDYVSFREGRDKQLEMPLLILPSLQVNIRAGNFPPPEDNGTVYLKLPVNRL
jgi:glyoxylase-like metal-dependent hydrolase (beta-lactamase superfamily II)